MLLRPFQTLRGCTLAASDGEIGKVREFYFDDAHWTVRYLVVETGSWLTGREVLIAPHALGEVDPQSGTLAVALSQAQVRGAPPIETEKPVSRQYEARVHDYYGWAPYWGGAAAGPGMMLPPPALAPLPAFAPPPEVTENLEATRPPGDPTLRSSAELTNGYTIRAQDGEIGRVEDFIVDVTDWGVRYLVIRTGAWFFGKDVLLAPEWIERISYPTAEVFVNLPRASIKDAPEYDAAAPLSRAFEQRLHDHYGRKGYWDAVRAAGMP